jgi:DNA-binding GntR family transcriptional regulator
VTRTTASATKTTASARVIESIRGDIAAGRLKIGDRLPTRRELCTRYGIATMTAARVIRALTDEGVAISDIGRGVFVAAVPTDEPQSSDGTQSAQARLERLEARMRVAEERLGRLENAP